MKSRLLVIGAGGHARVVLSIARHQGGWDIAGVLDRKAPADPNNLERIGDTPVIGSFDDAEKFLASGVREIALAVGDNDERAALFDRFAALGFAFPVLRHPTAIVEDDVKLGNGCVICAGVILGIGVVLGQNVIVNTGAILDHESTVGNHAHVAPGCRIAGRVRIGELAFVGIGTCVREKITCGARTVIGAGSVVVKDMPPGVVAFGSPARVERSR